MPGSNAALAREFTTVRKSFRQLARAFSRIAPLLGEHEDVVVDDRSGRKRPRRRPRLSARQRAALKLQGKYMGTMRGLKPAQRARMKKIRVAKGIHAAIRAAERMA